MESEIVAIFIILIFIDVKLFQFPFMIENRNPLTYNPHDFDFIAHLNHARCEK